MHQQGAASAPNTVKVEPKGHQNEPRKLLKYPLRDMIEQVRKNVVWSHDQFFGPIMATNQLNNYSKTIYKPIALKYRKP